MANNDMLLECDTCGNSTFEVYRADDGGLHVECEICNATLIAVPAPAH